ncbi:MAG: fructose-bisphosphate aldolase class I [Candidatus Magasanikbacteria bacterium]|nr:fructose-bisphosphate aldolase class I [Candidatus Magasanikbacteria bacterium]
MDISQLQSVARSLVAPGKGILAADESSGTIKKRFDKIGVESTEANRQAYRELLFTTPGIGQYISGVILYDETIRQSAKDGRTFVQALNDQGIIPGIKVDKGTVALPFSPEEKMTEGLDGLRQRLEEYVKLGAKFAKWRGVITIKGTALPTANCLHANAYALAVYAALCQEAGLVPIVEPEVLMDGNHSLERCYEVTRGTLKHVFEGLRMNGVHLSGMLLKPNMVIAGKEAPAQATPPQVAEQTVQCFVKIIPAEVPGLVFLSGGQSEKEACANLNAMNIPGAPAHPWELSFSYGRALQSSALEAWGGKAENVAKAQEVFAHRAKLVSAARSGIYQPALEQ